MVEEIIVVLYEVHAGTQEMRTYRPWDLLLILKWALQGSNASSKQGRVSTRNDLHAVLNILHEADNHLRMPAEYEHVTLFLRHLAYQQFTYQQDADAAALARQNLIFADLPADHSFQREFTKTVGVSIAETLEIALSLLCVLLDKPSPMRISEDDLSRFRRSFSSGSVDRVLKHLSGTISELHVWLNETEVVNISLADQKILPSPFLERPLLLHNGAYFIYYAPLLMRSLESIVHRCLRARMPETFGAKFGPLFERYVGLCLANAGIVFWDEARLKNLLPGEGKCVDFMWVEENCTILMDAKGVEMSSLGKVSHSANFILRALKKSAVKAISQGLEMDIRLKSLLNSQEILAGTAETFLLVVTHETLNLGSTHHFSEIFGKHLFPKLSEEFGNPLPIPFENMFFITIDQLERLLSRVRLGQTTVLRALRHARSQDAVSGTRKFNFQQHLETLCSQTERLPILDQKFIEMLDGCILTGLTGLTGSTLDS